MLIVQGNSDGTGDGIMVAADVASLATTYRSRGVPVQYTELTGQDHTAAGSSFVFAALGFLGQHLPVPPTPTRHAVHATLKGHSKGHKDVLVVKAKGAAGATVTITRAGHRKVLGHGTIKKNGKVTIKVKDRNGSAKTRYRATVGATATTLGATTKVLALR